MWKHKKHIIFLFLLSFTLVSCHFKPFGILSEEKLENILFEMHKTEGALQSEGFNLNTTPEEKKKYYDEILKKYDVSQADFDSTLVWYTKHPKEFGELYQNILTRFDTLSAEVQRGKYHPKNNQNGIVEVDLWNLRRNYKLTKDSARTKINFEILNTDNLLVGDKYVLSFLRRVATSDSSVNPHIVLKINYINGKSDSIYTKTYNDNLLRRYTLIFKARDTLKIKSLSGYLLGNKISKGKMNATLDSIKLIRKFNVYNVNKLKLRLDLKDKITPQQ